MSDGAERPPEPTCPRCGEQKMVESTGYVFYCNVCGKTFTIERRAQPRDSEGG